MVTMAYRASAVTYGLYGNAVWDVYCSGGWVLEALFYGGHPVVYRQLFIVLVPSIHNICKYQVY